VKEKKILRIISTLNTTIGGTARIATDQSNELVKRGYKVDILTLDKKKYNKNEKFYFKLINLGINKKKNIFSLTFFLWILKNWKKYDVFLIDGIWEFSTIVASFFLKKKYFVFIHGQIDQYFSSEFYKKIKKKIYWKLIEKKNLLNSKSVILSGEAEQKMFKNTFVDTKNIPFKTINYGISKFNFFNLEKKLKKIKKKHKKILEKKYILFIGRIHPKKGCDIFLKALEKTKVPNNYNIVIAGFLFNNNNFENQILNKIKKNKYSSKIFCLPFQDRINKFALIKFSECTILPSRGENFGISVVESLMMGRIPILTNKVGVYKKIKQSSAGIICKCNKNSISESLNYFFSISNKIKKKIEKNTKNCYSKNFSMDKTINDLEKLIENKKG